MVMRMFSCVEKAFVPMIVVAARPKKRHSALFRCYNSPIIYP